MNEQDNSERERTLFKLTSVADILDFGRITDELAQARERIAQLLRRIGEEDVCECGVTIYRVRHRNGSTPYEISGVNHDKTCRLMKGL